MQARTQNPRAGREPNYEGFRPRANHDGRIVVDKHNIHTGVRQHPMRVRPGADDDLFPKAQKIVREVYRNGELPILRKNRTLRCIKVHSKPKSRSLAALLTILPWVS
jgi:hypothetical protein